MDKRELQYWVLRALQNKKFGDDFLKKHIEWCKNSKDERFKEVNEIEAKAYEIVLNNQYQEFLTSEYNGHKVEYINDNCLKIDNKYIKIVESREFTYSIKKTQINAIGGALGLMKSVFSTLFDWQAFGRGVCEKVPNIKEMKVA